jgi:hypothetical protein
MSFVLFIIRIYIIIIYIIIYIIIIIVVVVVIFNVYLDCFYEEGVCYHKEAECVKYGSDVEACNSNKHGTNTPLGIYLCICIYRYVI